MGTIVIETEVDPHIKEVIKDLRKLGLMTAIVTGDREESARQIGQLAGIDQVDSRATPEDKFDKIAKLQKSGHAVAMVGDGINDAAALASADLGIAIGSGADVAIESADVVLVEPDLRRIVYVVRLARQTLRTIKQNIGWALIYNLLLIPVAGGILVPWGGPELPATLAAAAMTLSSLSVVTNSLRLTRFR